MHPVGDHLHGHPRILQQGDHRTGLAVVHRPHGVEQVGADARAGVDGRPRLLVGGVGVADRGDRAGVHHLPDRGRTAGPLGGQGDHPDRPPARRQHPVELGRFRVAQRGQLVGAASTLRQPRPLQVDAGHHAAAHLLGQHPDLPQQLGRVGGDQRGDHRGGAVPPVQLDRRLAGRHRRLGEGAAPAAVHVHVDEPGHDGGRAQVVVGRPTGRQRRRPGPDREHPAVGDLDPAGPEQLRSGGDGVGGEQHGRVLARSWSGRGRFGLRCPARPAWPGRSRGSSRPAATGPRPRRPAAR